MALPPLPPSNTARLRIAYQTGGSVGATTHSFTVRYAEGAVNPFDVITDLGDNVANWLDTDFFTGWSFTGVTRYAEGSDVGFPMSLQGAMLTFVGAGQPTTTQEDQARECRLVGRGLSTGRKTQLAIYGVDNNSFPVKDFRMVPAQPSSLAELRVFLMQAPNLYGISIGGDPAQWYDYTNWQYNSYWERTLRA